MLRKKQVLVAKSQRNVAKAQHARVLPEILRPRELPLPSNKLRYCGPFVGRESAAENKYRSERDDRRRCVPTL
jgi:hypothetical protein